MFSLLGVIIIKVFRGDGLGLTGLLLIQWLYFLFPLSRSCTSLDIYLSDHGPILLQAHIPQPKIKPFKFMKVWIDHPQFLSFVTNVWNVDISASTLTKLQVKLKGLRKQLKQWNWEGDVQKKKSS